MTRYTTDTFVTASVPATSSLDIERTIPVNSLDIAKIKIVPSIGTGTNIFQIFKKAARFFGDILYSSTAFTGVLSVDPETSAGAELNQGAVLPYYDVDEALQLHLRITNNHTVAKTYTITIEYEALNTDLSGILGSPDGIYLSTIANGLNLLAGLTAESFKDGCIQAELRAKYVADQNYSGVVDLRTVAEGGTWVPNITTDLQLVISATAEGAQWQWASAAQGRWYVTARIKNAVGWSLWTDGNSTPSFVVQYVDTQNFSDTGPPADWDISLETGPAANTVIVRACRPRTNGNNLLSWCVQVKDVSTGSWRTLDANAGAAETHYDGSLVSHSYATGYLTKPTSGWGTAVVGDLVLVDVRGGNFDVNYCMWFIIGENDLGTTTLYIGPNLRGGVTADLRIKIVKPPWTWSTDGYFGAQPGLGYWPEGNIGSDINQEKGIGWIAGDYSTKQFVSAPIPIPAGTTQVEARVWFENCYSRSDDTLNHSVYTQGTAGPAIIIPGIMTDFSDRSLWVPIYPPANYGTLTFSNGSAIMSVVGASESSHAGVVGVRGRFRMWPAPDFTIRVRAKFTNVTLPVGLASADRLGLGIWLTDGFHGYGGLFPLALFIIGTNAKVKMGGSTSPAKNYDAGIGGDLADPYSKGYNAYTSTSVDRPVPGSTIEIIANWGAWSYSGNFSEQKIEWRLGGSGIYSSSTYGLIGRDFSPSIKGADVFIGWFGNCRLNGATATLVEAEIITGLGEVF
jgi:hypothetical protein